MRNFIIIDFLLRVKKTKMWRGFQISQRVFLAGFFIGLFLTGCLKISGQEFSPTSAVCPTPDSENTAGICLPGGLTVPTQEELEPAGSPGIVVLSTQTSPVQTSPAAVPPQPTENSTLYDPVNADETSGRLFLESPIAPPGNHQVDTSYRFGSTQDKKRDPHHGVEFLNPQGTPVLAAADGIVLVAGDDKETRYSQYLNYYGNLVVIEHDRANLDHAGEASLPLFTLYAHLSEVMVKAGQKVQQGQEIGRVGMTGGATGSHLHFEVRLGENTYAASRNPELWLNSGLDDSGQQKGALAVQVYNPQGKPVAVKGVVIAHLQAGPGSSSDWEIYVDSYEEKLLLGNSPWYESFAAGSLPAGWYRISFPHFGLQRQEIQVRPGVVTLAVFNVE